ncbi:MFS transporter [Cryobacterium psychrophilum]|uniref:MFS transporter n=1 Tax=Cryobacterium psychrophilum TaxID=41988 RepID=UPI003BB0EE67
MFSIEVRRRSIRIWLVWALVNFSYYSAFIWLPTLLMASGFPLVKSFGFTLIITLAQLSGYAASAYLVEKWGRRVTLSTFLIGSAGAAAAFGFGAVNGSETQIIIFGMLLSFFNLGAWGALYAITPELYTTRLRGSGTGSAAAVGRIASIAAPLLVQQRPRSGRADPAIRRLWCRFRGGRRRRSGATGTARTISAGLVAPLVMAGLLAIQGALA